MIWQMRAGMELESIKIQYLSGGRLSLLVLSYGCVVLLCRVYPRKSNFSQDWVKVPMERRVKGELIGKIWLEDFGKNSQTHWITIWVG